MTRPSHHLVVALRSTADCLADPNAPYQWGHMGGCNCGHLAQTVTKHSATELHAMAMKRVATGASRRWITVRRMASRSTT